MRFQSSPGVVNLRGLRGLKGQRGQSPDGEPVTRRRVIKAHIHALPLRNTPSERKTWDTGRGTQMVTGDAPALLLRPRGGIFTAFVDVLHMACEIAEF